MWIQPNKIVFLMLVIMFKTTFTLQSKQIEGVLLLDSNTFSKALKDFNHLLVYFSSQECQYCPQFDLTFAILDSRIRLMYSENHFPSSIQFAKIVYQKSPEIFSTYNIKDAPNLRMFIDGKIIPIQYDSLDYNQDAIPYTEKWIKRLVSELPIYEKGQSQKNSVVVQCSNTAAKNTLKQMSRRDIENDYYCTNDKSLVDQESAVIYKKDSTDKKELKLNQNFNINLREVLNYYQGLIKWSNSIVREMFTYNQNGFVLLLNNEDYSDNMFRIYKEIRQDWFTKDLFVYGDLMDDIQQISKIKEFIGTQIEGQYPFPLLCYMSFKDGRVLKYKFKKEIVQKNQNEPKIYYYRDQVETWMKKAVKGQLQEHFKTFSDEETDAINDFGHGDIRRVNYVDLVRLFAPIYTQPFFIYVEWRNNFLCNYIADALIKKWLQYPYYTSVNMYSFGLNTNDLLPELQKRITKVPAMIYVDGQKNVKIQQDIGSFEDVLNFIQTNLDQKVNEPNAKVVEPVKPSPL